MNLRDLKGRCAHWQERLNLREWAVSLQWMSPRESRDFHGLCAWSTEELTAVIKISKTSDLEGSLVHELLHLVLEGHAEYGGYNADTERAINRISAALIQGEAV